MSSGYQDQALSWNLEEELCNNVLSSHNSTWGLYFAYFK
jgi:hypothetical protein